MSFEWDIAKDAANRSKHGLAFEDAAAVFRDPLARSRQDRHENGEERWQTLGMVGGVVLVLVAHTSVECDAEEVIRIISATRH